jgi:hypothetical protein
MANLFGGRWTVSLATALILTLGLSGCGGGNQTVNMEASWAETYHTMKDLKAHSDLGVLGTFTNIVGQTVDEGIPFTDFAFTVNVVLWNPKGSNVTAGTILQVHQTGGTVDNVVYQIVDDPLFKVGEENALFLDEYNPERYNVVGGPTGRFEVVAGVVTPHDQNGVPFSGSPQAFAQEVAKA